MVPPPPPSTPGWGTPPWDGISPPPDGYPPHHIDLAGVPTPTIKTWLGYPRGWGTPQDGVPPQTWDGVTP